MIAKNIARYLGFAFMVALVVMIAAFNGYLHGRSAERADNNAEAAALSEELREAESRLNIELMNRAEYLQSINIVNGERIDAIETIESNRREIARLEDMLASAIGERDQARTDLRIGIIELNHVERVWGLAVSECSGLPESDQTFLVPRSGQQTTTQSVAEGFKRIIKLYCELGVNYNGLSEAYNTTREARMGEH